MIKPLWKSNFSQRYVCVCVCVYIYTHSVYPSNSTCRLGYFQFLFLFFFTLMKNFTSFGVDKNWKQPSCSSAEEWITKLSYVQKWKRFQLVQKMDEGRDSAGGPVVKNLPSNEGMQVQSLVRELRSPKTRATRPQAAQCRIHTPQRRLPHAATKTRCSQINR